MKQPGVRYLKNQKRALEIEISVLKSVLSDMHDDEARKRPFGRRVRRMESAITDLGAELDSVVASLEAKDEEVTVD
jgi:hypothetical protein